MKVIISGINRVEFCTVKKKKDFDRRFFLTRGQLYYVPTDALVRMRVYEYGKERDSEAVILYEENSIVPYDKKDIRWSMNNLLSAIDRYKMMTNYGFLKKNVPWFENVMRRGWAVLATPTGIVVLIIVYLFITGGIKV